jgi:pSer/pThr/pTyr-binding forkhead associated (FHA) protein
VLAEPILLSRSQVYVVGRTPEADVQVKAENVSRQHAKIHFCQHGFVITDLGSTNGTLLNSVRLRPNVPVVLHHMDRLNFGGYDVVLKVVNPGELPLHLGGATQTMRRKRRPA